MSQEDFEWEGMPRPQLLCKCSCRAPDMVTGQEAERRLKWGNEGAGVRLDPANGKYERHQEAPEGLSHI